MSLASANRPGAVPPAVGPSRLSLTYVLPIRRDAGETDDDLDAYLRVLATWVDELIVVDGSPATAFAGHGRRWAGCGATSPPTRRCRTRRTSRPAW